MSSGAASSRWAAILRALSATLFAARAADSPPTASERDPYVPMPNGPFSVSPWMICTWSGEEPIRSATICAKPVSWPCPCGEAPVYTVAVPDGCTRTIADSQKPAWMPTPLGPTARDGARPQIST